MSGLEKIIDHINNQAREEADKLTAEARQKVEEIQRNAKVKLDKEIENIKSRRDRERNLRRDRILSNGELEARNLVLKMKQDLMDEVFNKALDNLKNMSDEEYLRYIESRLENKETLIVVQKGRKESLEKLNKNLNIHPDRFVESGFVAVVDNVEENFTFEALFQLVRDESQVDLAKILFED